MIRSVLTAVFIAAGATMAFAQTDPVAHRIELMKRVGDTTKPVAEMLKGTMAFDLAKAKEALAAYATAAKEYPQLFPEDSKNGKDSTAAPKIWETKADFDAKLAKWGEDTAAADAKVTDEASFKSEFKIVLGACKGCHDDYRIKK